MSLVPCPSCHRHIRTGEHACPFCGGELPAALAARAIPGATQRLSRAAAFAFTASLALTNCGPSVSPAPADAAPADAAGPGDGGVAPAYGAPAPDAGPGPGDGGVASLYGAVPAPDGGTPDAAPGPDASDPGDGGVAPLYGAVPAPDGGADAAEGSIGVRYGAPPRDL